MIVLEYGTNPFGQKILRLIIILSLLPPLFIPAINSSDTSTKKPSSITCIPKKSDIVFGEGLIVEGVITPPVGLATIKIDYKMGSTTITKITFTKADGTYSFPSTIRRDPGSWTVEAYWDGDATYEGARSAPAPFTLSWPTQTAIRITVIDEDGEPIAGAELMSKTKPGEQAALKAVSGPDGAFSFTRVTAGTYTFEARREGFTTNSGTVIANDGIVSAKTIILTRIATPQTPPQEEPPTNSMPGYQRETLAIGIIIAVAVLLHLKKSH